MEKIWRKKYIYGKMIYTKKIIMKEIDRQKKKL